MLDNVSIRMILNGKEFAAKTEDRQEYDSKESLMLNALELFLAAERTIAEQYRLPGHHWEPEDNREG